MFEELTDDLFDLVVTELGQSDLYAATVGDGSSACCCLCSCCCACGGN